MEDQVLVLDQEPSSSEQAVQLSFVYRGSPALQLSVSPNQTLRDLGEQLHLHFGIVPHTLRLLLPHKATSALLPFSEEHGHLTIGHLGITEGRTIRIMGALPGEIKEVSQGTGQNYERGILGFSDEDRRARQRLAVGSAGPGKLPQGSYIFCDFQTLQLPGIVLHPPAEEALKIMHRLASDRGIVAIMNKHRWRVGVMTEMAPVGYVGISPKCILGYNKNHGEEIALRLRTDDLKGFRKYESIKKTLLHELAHMVHSEHDANFQALDKQLNEEAISLDWTKSQGHTWGGMKAYDGEESIDAGGVQTVHGHKVGGRKEHYGLGARSAAALAALQRLSQSTEKLQDDNTMPVQDANSMLPEVDVIAQGFQIDNESDAADPCKHEPDPDDCREVDEKMLEPDPDFVDSTSFPGKLVNEVLNSNLESGLQDAERECTAHDGTFQEQAAEMEHEPTLKGWSSIRAHHSNNDNEAITEPESDVLVKQDLNIQTNRDAGIEAVEALAVPETSNGLPPIETKAAVSELIPEDSGLKALQVHTETVCKRLQDAVKKLKTEATPAEASAAVQTLFNILRNLKDYPNEAKFKRLRKTNPAFQSRIAKFTGAMEVLQAVGFSDSPHNIAEENDFLVLTRNDPVLLWLAQTTLESCMA